VSGPAKVLVLKRRLKPVAATATDDAAAPERGDGDDDCFLEPEDYWQAAYCAALQTLGPLLAGCRSDEDLDAVIRMARRCADVAFNHALEGCEETA